MSLSRQDEPDACGLGKERESKSQSLVTVPIERERKHYNIHHKTRGKAIIFAYSEYSKSELPRRDFAPHDVQICTKAFKRLGYEVTVHWNFRKRHFLNILDEVRKADHSESDSLVIIFMSHGGVEKLSNNEYLWTSDAPVYTTELWRNFTPENCPTLVGKPKMFFIQACRGTGSDKGVKLKNDFGLKVETDAVSTTKKKEDLALPICPDMLMMWASYPGTYAFNSYHGVINGSVFLHYLVEVLDKWAEREDLFSMLLRLTREVAIHYEAYCPSEYQMHKSKQIPYLFSTLTKNMHFFEKKSNLE
ncbi:hypothetical protein SK128_011667 [Halocaridina rubra]|uniref:Caspase n=1 Tax=Halocaridina rubra TaxID=373956 RepID=A0AAN8XFW4_HALRR